MHERGHRLANSGLSPFLPRLSFRGMEGLGWKPNGRPPSSASLWAKSLMRSREAFFFPRCFASIFGKSVSYSPALKF